MENSYIYESDILTKEFLQQYRNKQPNWGFNGLGYIVYKRTYSRVMDYSTGQTEEWWQTISRCINGAQKIGANYSKEEAEKLYDYIFNLKCNFPGRMLWQLGTSTVDKFGIPSLCNCWFVIMDNIDAFCFLFEHLMLGGGVGFSVKREHVHELPKVKNNVKILYDLDTDGKPTKDADFIVPDSREGWVSLLKKVLNSYFYTGESFSYSTILIRGAGEPIKGFGGKASGPKYLQEMIENISKVLDKRAGKKVRSIDVLDICNIIGVCVVSGNVRRSAQISLGDADDILFARAKRWDLVNIPNWRSMSNNSIYCDSYDHIMENIWDGYGGNGEPYGFVNLNLARKYGRLGEKIKDNVDGWNPCQPKWATVLTKNGVSTIGEIDTGDEIWSESGWTKVINKWSTGIKPVYKFSTDGYNERLCEYSHFIGTENHRVLSKGEKIEISKTTTADFFNDDSPDGFVLEPVCIMNCNITDVEYIGEEEVFDITVDNNTHTYWTGGLNVSNCGEATLENYEPCDLAELYLNNIDSKEELIECSKLLYKTQKAILRLPSISKKTEEVVRRNMRIGLGVTGICQSLDKVEWLDDCYKSLKQFDKEWSLKNNWPTSVKLTVVKPSGTISILSGSTPGIHPGFSKYFIRRIRMASNDTLVDLCKSLGYNCEFVRNFDGTLSHDTVVIEFPCEFGDETILAKDMSAIRQLEMVKKIQRVWADQSVSCTVYYKKDELEEIKAWLKEHYKNNIKSISFLLHQDHGFDQAPYSEVTEVEYRKMLKKIKPIIGSNIFSGDLDTQECAGGACPIK